MKSDKKATAEPERLVTGAELCELFGIHRGTLYRWMAKRGFPPQIQVGPRFSRWRESDVRAWINSHQRVSR